MIVKSDLHRKVTIGSGILLILLIVVLYIQTNNTVYWVHASSSVTTGDQAEFMAVCGNEYATELKADDPNVKIATVCDNNLFTVTSDTPVSTTLTATVHLGNGKSVTGTYDINFTEEDNG